MGRKKIPDDQKKNKLFHMLFTSLEFSQITIIKNLLNVSIAGFIRICIREWIENHKEILNPIFSDN